LRKYDLLSLKTNIFWPFNEARKVSFGLNVLADGKIFGTSIEERVLCSLGGFASTEWRSGRLLSFLDGRLVIELGNQPQSRRGPSTAHGSPEL